MFRYSTQQICSTQNVKQVNIFDTILDRIVLIRNFSFEKSQLLTIFTKIQHFFTAVFKVLYSNYTAFHSTQNSVFKYSTAHSTA